jgi:hypothetical protein
LAKPDPSRPRSCEVAAECPTGSACAIHGEPPCTVVAHSHAEKLRICDDLEEIANTLPARFDRMKCLQLANALVPLMRSSHRYEEEVVFPAYAAMRGREESLRRLRAEHIEDECFADEVTEALLTMGHGAEVTNPEAVGFMLRGFFELVRRHVAFEREHVLPAVNGLLARQVGPK